MRLLRVEQVRRQRAGSGAVVPQEPVRQPVDRRRTQRTRGGRPLSRADRAVRARPPRRRRHGQRVRVLRETRFPGQGHDSASERLQHRGPKRAGCKTRYMPLLCGQADAHTRQCCHIQLPLPLRPENRRHSFQRLQQEHYSGVRRGAQHRQCLYRLVEFTHHEQQSGQSHAGTQQT